MKKKVRWLTPSKISEQNVDSNSDKSESELVTAEEEEGYEEVGTEPLLQQEGCTPLQSCYIGCSSAQVTHRPSSPSTSEDDGGGGGSGDDDNDVHRPH